ncbi:ubiquitin carboxyl-terminal hydrolase 16-like [Saccostrea echinata]|uniref:ubiquitin carboxyl-terminal hydrolase 16-like n=1 Tax=Saccostrea echinata TaxID=191078 RepID=UPI002A808137|nr:ubiquitin carboxyl-terminal hydrolase 16-like [Saccostrea echinata]
MDWLNTILFSALDFFKAQNYEDPFQIQIPVIVGLCFCLLYVIQLCRRNQKSEKYEEERRQNTEKEEVKDLVIDTTLSERTIENSKLCTKESCVQTDLKISTKHKKAQATVFMKDASTQTYQVKKPRKNKKRSKDPNKNGIKWNTDKVPSSNVVEFEPPKGNRNLGNTCFFNSSLQALYFTKSLREVLTYLKDSDANFENMILSQRLLDLLEKQSKKDEDHTNELKGVLNAVRNINNQFGRGTQEDSYELLNTLLGGILDEIIQNVKSGREEGICQEKINFVDLKNNWTNANIKNLFSGLYITIYFYETCEDVEVEFEDFTTLSIPIVEEFDNEFIHTHHKALNAVCLKEPENDIEKGLASLTQIEEYEERDLPCRLCKTEGTGKVYRRLLIYQPPPILIIHIDRFKMSGFDQLTKNSDMVQYLRTLCLSKFCSVANKNISEGTVTYELYAVVVHSGGINSGHYYAYVNTSRKHDIERWQEVIKREAGNLDNLKSELENVLKGSIETRLYERNVIVQAPEAPEKWFYVSDEHVQSVSSDTVFNQKDAYILFYEIQ